ncbi:hypothetical protein C8K36_1011315 [Rhodococcus sp. OK519]|uniref:hypothetical protein n=1 Tax=Rhodococcus sp. OK519 TaxID=2135729 RepID=UPI000D4D13D9|nr:hypothetical protein C8K36_1011315 [Rhodococcus sp. OK519]
MTERTAVDARDDEAHLLAGSSVPVTDAITCAYAQRRQRVVCAEALYDHDESTDG